MFNNPLIVSPYISIDHMDYFSAQLYPHSFDPYVLIVPTQYQSASKLFQLMMYNNVSNIWVVAILSFTLVRKLCQHYGSVGRAHRRPASAWTTIYFQTVGVSFGGTGQQPKNRSEAIAMLFLTLFALLGGIMYSGMIFAQFSTSDQSPTIQSVAQLVQRTDVELVLPRGLNASLRHWMGRHGAK